MSGSNVPDPIEQSPDRRKLVAVKRPLESKMVFGQSAALLQHFEHFAGVNQRFVTCRE